ncbi:MAG TPA: Ig-like domain-containing protein [Verrucomicrobiae bacterium]
MFIKPTIYREFPKFAVCLFVLLLGGNSPAQAPCLGPNPSAADHESRVFATALPGAPNIQLLAPANGSTISLGTSLLLSANASDSDGIDFVDFLRNGERIGRAARSASDANQYTLVWIATIPGTHTISARATDLFGTVATSAEVTITVGEVTNPPVDTTPPSVQIISPANGTTVNLNGSVTISASASDAQGSVEFVEFLRNGSVFARGTPVAGQVNQYSTVWTASAAGTHAFSARAVDVAGNSATSAAVSVVVAPTMQDTTPPSAQFISPLNGSSFNLNSAVTFTVTARDPQRSPVTVDILRNGAVLGRAVVVSGEPNNFRFTWNATVLGQQTFTARATDAAGNSAISTGIRVNVANPPPTQPPANIAPTVSITSPTAGSELLIGSIFVAVRAADSDGTVTKVELLVNGTVNATQLYSASSVTGTLLWRPRLTGSYTLAARATDNRGAVTTSGTIPVTVKLRETLPPVTISISAGRNLPDQYRERHPVPVEIKVRTESSAPWRIEENPPRGWRVTGLSEGGEYDSINHKVVFRSSTGKSRDLKYYAIPPRGATGTQTFSGTASVGSQSAAIKGDTQIAKRRTGGDDDDRDRSSAFAVQLDANYLVHIEKGRTRMVTLEFTSEPGVEWVVEFCTALDRNDWSVLPGSNLMVSEAREYEVQDSGSAGLRFYRLRRVE